MKTIYVDSMLNQIQLWGQLNPATFYFVGVGVLMVICFKLKDLL